MTERERFLETLLFGKPDRIPLTPGNGRKSTRERWYGEGLPEDVEDIAAYAYQQAGGTLPWSPGGEALHPDQRMNPMFEEKVIEERADSHVVQDWKGNICEIAKEFGTEYLRDAIDFVTRRWIKCPVETRADWEDMKTRYEVDDPMRLPEDAAERGERLADREHVVQFSFSGPFWQLREWLGFEQLCVMFYDDPEFLQDMLDFWSDFVAGLLERSLAHVTPDMVHLSEDMAYKGFSMISPDMTRKYLLPIYQRWGAIVKGAGVPVYAMDSDGFIGELIPIWIEAGINVCDPIEVAAGNDINEFRKMFGNKMAYRGGVDKRAIAKGGDVIVAEIERISPVIADGGYIPGCDHGVPHDISWPDYVRYVGLLADKTGWM